MNSFLWILITVLGYSNAKPQVVTGKVTAFGEIPLAKVEVRAKSGDQVLTDSEGRFKLETRGKKDVVYFYASGFGNRKIKKLNVDQLHVNLLLEEGETAKKKAVANQHLSVEDLKKGIASVGFTNYKYYELSSIYEVLRMEHPGLRFDESGSDPNIYLVNQGVNSFFGGTEALLVIDGQVVSDISMILPTQVKEVAVLQGADASIWGVRGANGVIEITLLDGSE